MWGFYNSPPEDSVSQTQVCISIRYFIYEFRFLQASGIQISFVEIARWSEQKKGFLKYLGFDQICTN